MFLNTFQWIGLFCLKSARPLELGKKSYSTSPTNELKFGSCMSHTLCHMFSELGQDIPACFQNPSVSPDLGVDGVYANSVMLCV